VILAVLLMLVTALGFVGMGLVFASRITDPQTSKYCSFFDYAAFFASGAVFPIETAPPLLQSLALLTRLPIRLTRCAIVDWRQPFARSLEHWRCAGF